MNSEHSALVPLISFAAHERFTFRRARTKFENRFSCRTGPLTLVLNNISVRGTAIYEVRIWYFVVGVQNPHQHCVECTRNSVFEFLTGKPNQQTKRLRVYDT